jgi:hypothetical protein
MIIIATNENQYSTVLTFPRIASSIIYPLQKNPDSKHCPGLESNSFILPRL